MKKFMLFFVLLAFMVAAPMAMAKEDPKKKEPKINCCVKGKCKKMTKQACEKNKGLEVIDCKDCKPEPKPTKPPKSKGVE